MTMAVTAPHLARIPAPVFEVYVRTARRLCTELGVTIRFVPMPRDELGDFDDITGTLLIREDADVVDQLWLMSQSWWLLTIGPWATDATYEPPSLRLVPPPREPADLY